MRRFLPAMLAATLLAEPAARAQAPVGEEPPPEPPAPPAEVLFRDAKSLMAGGRYAEACPKLAESHRLDPAGGTLLTLALCHEREGKTASAWAEFVQAAEMARADGRADREAIANERAAALEPRVCRLVVRVDEQATGIGYLEVWRDGLILDRARWNVADPVDPGPHLVEARAPGKRSFRASVELVGEGARAAIEVPMLEDLARPLIVAPPFPPPEATPPAEEAPTGLPAPTVGAIVIGSVAVVASAVGIYLAVRAADSQSQANDICPDVACTDPTAVDLNDDARASADGATAAFVVAGVSAAASIVLFVVGAIDTPSSTGTNGAVLRF
jgi:hypothetical protein